MSADKAVGLAIGNRLRHKTGNYGLGVAIYERSAVAVRTYELRCGPSSGAQISRRRVSGDSLDILIGELQEVATEPDPDEAAFGLKCVIERLLEVQKHYEAVLQQKGQPLPYPPFE